VRISLRQSGCGNRSSACSARSHGHECCGQTAAIARPHCTSPGWLRFRLANRLVRRQSLGTHKLRLSAVPPISASTSIKFHLSFQVSLLQPVSAELQLPFRFDRQGTARRSCSREPYAGSVQLQPRLHYKHPRRRVWDSDLELKRQAWQVSELVGSGHIPGCLLSMLATTMCIGNSEVWAPPRRTVITISARCPGHGLTRYTRSF